MSTDGSTGVRDDATTTSTGESPAATDERTHAALRAPRPGRAVDAKVSRSWLLVNATDEPLVAEALASRADQVVVDIEDAVDPRRKAATRDRVVTFLADRADADTWVRINDVTTEFWADDVAALAGLPGLAGVMLAKTEAAEQVAETSVRLGGRTPVVALVESAQGIEDVTAIARSRGVFRLAFGSGDYRRDTGTAADDLAMAYPRSRLVVSSRVGGLPGPIDGPTVSTSHPVLRDQSEVSVALGMTGKLCLRREQVPVVNEVISPTVSDLVWAVEFLDDFTASGGAIRDGSDLPRLGRARKIVELAEALGIDPRAVGR